MLEDKFAAVQAQMTSKLEELRKTFDQASDKGLSVEVVLRRFLREYLPRRFEVGTGEIVDAAGHRSAQTDIVIVNEDHPLTFSDDTPGLFFIEGVSAVGEAKSILTSGELEKTIENSYLFKQLVSDPGKGSMICSNPSDIERFYKCPPYFLLAFESQLKLTTVFEKVGSFLEQKGFGKSKINTVLDAIFILNQGCVINFGDGMGVYKMLNDQNEPVAGWVWANSDKVLFNFMGWLSAVMPRIIRFSPILPCYLLNTIKNNQ